LKATTGLLYLHEEQVCLVLHAISRLLLTSVCVFRSFTVISHFAICFWTVTDTCEWLISAW
jgi:hypothetical protein